MGIDVIMSKSIWNKINSVGKSGLWKHINADVSTLNLMCLWDNEMKMPNIVNSGWVWM
jgi:hypothetical protein